MNENGELQDTDTGATEIIDTPPAVPEEPPTIASAPAVDKPKYNPDDMSSILPGLLSLGINGGRFVDCTHKITGETFSFVSMFDFTF
jgi:hypothetical protein